MAPVLVLETDIEGNRLQIHSEEMNGSKLNSDKAVSACRAVGLDLCGWAPSARTRSQDVPICGSCDYPTALPALDVLPNIIDKCLVDLDGDNERELVLLYELDSNKLGRVRVVDEFKKFDLMRTPLATDPKEFRIQCTSNAARLYLPRDPGAPPFADIRWVDGTYNYVDLWEDLSEDDWSPDAL